MLCRFKKIMKAFRIQVGGRVQRVGYRRYLLDVAQELGLSGYTRNEKDGTVTIFIQGEDKQVDKFLRKAKKPPAPASIKSFTAKQAKPNPRIKFFSIKFGSIQEELQEGFGAMHMEFHDYRREFRDYRREFKDFRREFDDFREEFRDYRNEFRDFREEFRDYRKEFQEFAKRTNENFKAILEKYGEISDKLTEILETLVRESKETREQLSHAMEMISESLRLLKEKQ